MAGVGVGGVLLEDGIAMIFFHHIYCAQSQKTNGGGGGQWGSPWCEWGGGVM